MNKYGLSAMLLLLYSLSAAAHEVDTRHGAVNDRVEPSPVKVGFSMTFQTASRSDVRNEALASFDLLSTLQLGTGELAVYVEGSTTPRRNGVSSVLVEANGDAGSALDGNGNGRLQVSELHYVWPVLSSYLYTGLINPTGLLDSSDVANDETRQFIGASFVNNPSIDFPDYTLGVAWHLSRDTTKLGAVIFFGSSHGIADNPSASYSELFDIKDSGKGVFAAAELYLPVRGTTIRSGIWVNSADHERFEQHSVHSRNYGIYANIDGQAGEGQWNLRLGVANEDVSDEAFFAATVLEYPLADMALGMGLAYTGLSDKIKDTQADDMTQTEVYARFTLPGQFELTPSIQWLQNSGFNKSNSRVASDAWVGTLRLTWPL